MFWLVQSKELNTLLVLVKADTADIAITLAKCERDNVFVWSVPIALLSDISRALELSVVFTLVRS
jgi:hypothetical protein